MYYCDVYSPNYFCMLSSIVLYCKHLLRNMIYYIIYSNSYLKCLLKTSLLTFVILNMYVFVKLNKNVIIVSDAE